MRTTLYSVLFWALFGASLSIAQAPSIPSISGTVYSNEGGKTPLPGADITAKSQNASEGPKTSAPDGGYSIALPPGDDVMIFYAASGHRPTYRLPANSPLDVTLEKSQKKSPPDAEHWTSTAHEWSKEDLNAIQYHWAFLCIDPVPTETRMLVASTIIEVRPELSERIPGLTDFGRANIEQVRNLSTALMEARRISPLSFEAVSTKIEDFRLPNSVTASVVSESLSVKDRSGNYFLPEELRKCFVASSSISKERDIFLRAGAVVMRRATLLQVLARPKLTEDEYQVLGNRRNLFVEPLPDIIQSTITPTFRIFNLGKFPGE